MNKYYRGIEIIKNDDGLYYLYNGQGDVSILTDSAGTTVANYTFDAYGNRSQENTIYNPFGYRGEYTDDESGLIYLRARMYEPETGRFINEDPIQDGYNWYIYCENNPILFIDYFGLAPTPEEAAEMAAHIYEFDLSNTKSERTVAGWRLVDVWYGRESMKMGIYIPDEDDWENPTEYAVVFKGTSSLKNWQNNAEAFLSSKSADLWDAINYGAYFDYMIEQEITFVGHSKGGGEAIAAASATNKNAITFNAANFNFEKYGISEGKGTITNYYVRGEILHTTIGKARIGTDHMLDTQFWNTKKYRTYNGYKTLKTPAPIKNHSMDAVKKALN